MYEWWNPLRPVLLVQGYGDLRTPKLRFSLRRSKIGRCPASRDLRTTKSRLRLRSDSISGSKTGFTLKGLHVRMGPLLFYGGLVYERWSLLRSVPFGTGLLGSKNHSVELAILFYTFEATKYIMPSIA